MSDPRASSVVILGSGAAGLITAYTLLQDGFTNVTVITRDSTPGGVWADERIYPGLTINNVHGEFRFCALQMPPARDPNGRLSGSEMRDYMQKFTATYLQDIILYGLEILQVLRSNGEGDPGWTIKVQVVKTGEQKALKFDRVVLCTGGCSRPLVPKELSPSAAKATSFKGRVFHSSTFRSQSNHLEAGNNESMLGDVAVIGGGKSAQDAAAYLARKGIKVTMVFETVDAFFAVSRPLPDFIRRSRFLSLLSPHSTLDSRLERFLHTTSLGSNITHFIWKKIIAGSFAAAGVTDHSPLKNTHDAFWGIRINDEGILKPDGFHKLVNAGKIKVVAPARVASYSSDGLVLNNGEKVRADTVVLATGYTSSWHPIFDETTSANLGLNRHPPDPNILKAENEWNNYVSLQSPPHTHPSHEQWASSVYRGIVPANNLLNKDFAINGAVFTTNNGYAFEVMAHWISSYFLGDKNLKLPSSPEEALAHADRNSAWLRKRYPGTLLWANESYSSNLAFWTWPQTIDELLKDMGLATYRSGGNWLTWPFKVIELTEIEHLKEERDAMRKLG
ncbi:hypothetical protein BDP27DRAFT_1413103 [Rhodocollybia butyracea]|uniref:FAD/NAD(P)-binding domain-containing protein n=1 Tax=Rhodocollybia butyracea TaxID=206335 RepID=A0A9P5UGA8_9AGAR|nr:hypothetical protein BDP27DRAFT_1413103 [Rhodocollybia butyracea]